MTIETIKQIEEQFPADGLTGYLFFLLTGGDYDKMCDTFVFPEGACMILKGSAPERERRDMFLKVYDGCRNIADSMKRNVGYGQIKECYWCNKELKEGDVIETLPESNEPVHEKCAEEWYGTKMAEE